jgi:hypothetical protein
MQAPPPPPTNQAEAEAEAIIPMEIVSNEDANMNGTVIISRKAAKRTLPWDLNAEELLLLSSQPPQAEDIPAARKKQRLEEPLPTTTTTTTTDEAARKTDSDDLSVGPPPATDGDIDIDDANTDTDLDPVMDTQPNAVASGNWTLEEDAKLTSAVWSRSKKKHRGEYKTDWVAISALVPGRTRRQCSRRWYDVLDPSIDRLNGRTGSWTVDEDSKLKDAVQTHGGKNWIAITALVPGRTKHQCNNRWRDVLDSSIDRENGRTGKWTAVEDSKLKDAVQMHGGKDWGAITALVPGRTRIQCRKRWKDNLDPSIDRSDECTGKWTAVEDSKLKDAVQTHGGKNWNKIAALVPGRTKIQCNKRWHHFLDPSIDPTMARTGKWTVDEFSKLKDAVQTHGGKNWNKIAALVPGRTKKQCWRRWKDVLNPSIALAAGRKGTWTAVEDTTLKDAVQMHGGKNWIAITALVPGRNISQCTSRWHDTLDPSIDRANERTGRCTAVEDSKLKDAARTHGGNNLVQLQRWFQVERKNSVGEDGTMPWIPASTGQVDARLIGHQSKTAS